MLDRMLDRMKADPTLSRAWRSRRSPFRPWTEILRLRRDHSEPRPMIGATGRRARFARMWAQ